MNWPDDYLDLSQTTLSVQDDESDGEKWYYKIGIGAFIGGLGYDENGNWDCQRCHDAWMNMHSMSDIEAAIIASDDYQYWLTQYITFEGIIIFAANPQMTANAHLVGLGNDDCAGGGEALLLAFGLNHEYGMDFRVGYAPPDCSFDETSSETNLADYPYIDDTEWEEGDWFRIQTSIDGDPGSHSSLTTSFLSVSDIKDYEGLFNYLIGSCSGGGGTSQSGMLSIADIQSYGLKDVKFPSLKTTLRFQNYGRSFLNPFKR